MPVLTKTLIENTPPNPSQELTLWDDRVKGLGCRIRPSGRRTFVIMFRSPETGKLAKLTLGPYGILTLEEARKRAQKALGKVADGKDPAREKRRAREEAKTTARTMTELADEYMRDARAGLVTYRGRPKKEGTIAIDAGRVERHIKPLLGKELVKDITLADVTAFFHDVRIGTKIRGDIKTGCRGLARVRGGQGTAARTVDLLGSIFSYAVRNGLRPDNPVVGFERPPSRRRDRMLSPAEYVKLGQALKELEEETLELEGKDKAFRLRAIAAIRVLALSGLRRSEAFQLKWIEVDAHRGALRLADTKTGQQIRPIGRAALDVIEATPRVEDVPYVFATKKGGPLVSPKMFQEAVKRAELEDVTIHTLRHSYASVGLELEYSELTIAGLLGHRSHSVTSRYAHHIDRALVAAADRVAARIARRLAGEIENKEGQVVQLRPNNEAA